MILDSCGKEIRDRYSGYRIYAQPTYIYMRNNGTIFYLDYPIQYLREVNIKNIPDDKRKLERRKI